MSRTTEERFKNKYQEKSKEECWIWQGALKETGYGKFQNTTAHRYSWRLYNKASIPIKLVIMHNCDNRACVNPEHLILSTQGNNLKDMYTKNRQGNRKLPLGEKHHITYLSIEQVKEIKSSTLSSRKLAKIYNTTHATVLNIKNGKTWSKSLNAG